MRRLVARTRRVARTAEWAAWIAGASLLIMHSTSGLWAQYAGDSATVQFEQSRRPGLTAADPDQSLWAPTRMRDYERARLMPIPVAEAIIRIRSVALEVPVFEGATDLHMTLGAGRILGSPGFGEPGNIGVSSHRDGHFRKLKDVRVGDRIMVDTLSASYLYEVEDILITDPSDTSVLWPGSRPELTLVTCYPFYYRGSAPQRFVVRAVLLSEESP